VQQVLILLDLVSDISLLARLLRLLLNGVIVEGCEGFAPLVRDRS